MIDLIQEEIKNYRAVKQKLCIFFYSTTNKNLIEDYFKIILNKELVWADAFIKDFWEDRVQIEIPNAITKDYFIPIYWFDEIHRKRMIEDRKTEDAVTKEFELYLKLKEKFEL
jgi:hypothetical protein